ncbi:uncharacterized protein LOC126830949 isoform X2 [Patella vulgata]|uniref:uncharacterized protein LOC126830949 isoform X2 n=1 Tax=Patella vulgata TaxID=6465 RepID=UPI00218034FB|nr:uncharacterized protein LOC126830949 isoform X2 [Patella vulgata]
MAQTELGTESEDWENKYLEDEELEFFTELALHETERWIQAVTRKKFIFPDDPRKSLEDGILFCELLNSIKNGSVKRINRQAAQIAGLDNLNVFLKACKSEFGLSETQLFDPADLEDLTQRAIAESEHLKHESDRRLRNVAITIYWLGRAVCHTYPVPNLDFSAFTPLINHHNKDIISNEHIYRLDSSCSWDSYDHSSAYGSNGGVSGNSIKDSINHRHVRDSSYESYASYGKASEDSLDEQIFDNMPVGGRLSSASSRQDSSPRYSATNESLYREGKRNGMYRSSPDLAVPSFNHRRSSSTDSLDGSYRSHSRQSSDSCDGYPTRNMPGRRISQSTADPLQFIKSRGAEDLAKQAEEQIKQVEEVKKTKVVATEIAKDEDDWQSTLGNWKSRRKSKSEAFVIKEEQEEMAKKKEEDERQNKTNSIKSFKQIQEERERRKSGGGFRGYPIDDEEEDDDLFISPIKSSVTQSTSSSFTAEHTTVTSTPSSKSKKSGNVAPWAQDSGSEAEGDQSSHSETEDKNNNQPLDNKTKDYSDINQSDYSEHNHSHNKNNISERSGVGRSSKLSDITSKFEADGGDSKGLADSVSRQNRRNNGVASPANKINNIRSRFESPEDKPVTRTAVFDAKVDLNARKKSFENFDHSNSFDAGKPPKPYPRDRTSNNMSTTTTSSSATTSSSVYSSNKITGKDCVEKNIKITSKRGFGFTICGGADEKQQVLVEKVSLGSAADVCELKSKDEVLSINKIDVSKLTNQEANNLIQESARQGSVEIRVKRFLDSNLDDSDEFISSDEEDDVKKTEQSRETTHSFDSSYSQDKDEDVQANYNTQTSYNYSEQPLIQQLKNDTSLQMQFDPNNDSSYQSAETVNQSYSSYTSSRNTSSVDDYINSSSTNEFVNTSQPNYVNTSQPNYVNTSEPDYINQRDASKFVNSGYSDTSEPGYNTNDTHGYNTSDTGYNNTSDSNYVQRSRPNHHDYVNTDSLGSWGYHGSPPETQKEDEVVLRRKKPAEEVNSSSSFDESDRVKSPANVDSGDSDGPPAILRKWQRQRPKSEYKYQDEKTIINQKRLSATLPWQPEHSGIEDRPEEPVLDRSASDYVNSQPPSSSRGSNFNKRRDRKRIEEWNNQQEERRQPADANENGVDINFTYNQAEFENRQEQIQRQYEEEQKRAAEIQLQQQQQEKELLEPEMERMRLLEERKRERRKRLEQLHQEDTGPMNAPVPSSQPIETVETRSTLAYRAPRDNSYQNAYEPVHQEDTGPITAAVSASQPMEIVETRSTLAYRPPKYNNINVYEPDYVNQPAENRSTMNIQVAGGRPQAPVHQTEEPQRSAMSFKLPASQSGGLVIDPRNQLDESEPVPQYSIQLSLDQPDTSRGMIIQPEQRTIPVHDANFIEQEKQKIRQEYEKFEKSMRQQQEEEERKFREREEKLRQQEERLRRDEERIRQEEEKLERERQNLLNSSAEFMKHNEPKPYQPSPTRVRGQGSLYTSTVTPANRHEPIRPSTFSTSMVVDNTRGSKHHVQKVEPTWPPSNKPKQPGNISVMRTHGTESNAFRDSHNKPNTSANRQSQDYSPREQTGVQSMKMRFSEPNQRNSLSREDMLAMNRTAKPLQKKPEGSDSATSPTTTGPIKRETPTRQEIHSLNAVPKPKLRQSVDWIGRNDSSNERRAAPRRSEIMKNQYSDSLQGHWVIEEAERRRMNSDLNVKSSTLPIQPGPYTGPVKPPRDHGNIWSDNSANHPRQSQYSSLPPRTDPNMPLQIRQTLLQKTASARGSNGSSYSQELNINVPQMSRNSPNLSQTMPASYGYDSPRSDYGAPRLSSQAPPAPDGSNDQVPVSGKQLCSSCNQELGFGAAMIIEKLGLYYHMPCFKCCVCRTPLGNGSEGADVRIRVNKLHCPNCYSNDEAGLKFSKV